MKRFNEVIDFLSKFEKIVDQDILISEFIDFAMSFLGCESGSFLRVDDRKKMLVFEIVKGKNAEELKGVAFGYSGVAGWCAENRKDILVKNTKESDIFTNKVDYATGYNTRSIIAVVIGYGNDFYGVIELINPLNKDFFDEEDFEFVKLLSYPLSYRLYVMRLENQIYHANNRLTATINNLAGGFIGVEPSGVIIFLNPRAKEILGIKEDLVGKSYTFLGEDLKPIKDILKDALNGKLVKRGEVVCRINSVDKKIGYSTIVLKSIDQSIAGNAIIFQDIT